MLIEPPVVVTFKVIDQNVMKYQKLLFIGLDTKCLPYDPFAFTPKYIVAIACNWVPAARRYLYGSLKPFRLDLQAF